MSCPHCDCDKDQPQDSYEEGTEAAVDDPSSVSEGLIDAITLLTLCGLQGTITLAVNSDGPTPFILDQVNLHRPYQVDEQGFPL